ncbi:MFS transporter [Catenuloplanes sp. NPDC051500]|uniref:MFS transporter n=1 Tax=Catenuloplanes sp. NPDC051500 TaxID=3363959 RepID=UPI003795246E
MTRDFRLYWIGQTTSRFGSSITTVALPLAAITVLQASTFQVALLTAAVWLPWLLVGLPAGVLVDRSRSRRHIMIGCDVVAAVLFVSVPVAAWLGVLTFAQLLVVALLTGLVSVFFETAGQVYLAGLLPAADLVRGNARLVGADSAAKVAGPGVGGLVAQVFGAVTGLLADALTFVVSAVCMLAVRHRETEPEVREPEMREPAGVSVAEGLRFVVRDPFLRVMTAFGATCNLAMNGYQAILVLFLVRENGADPGLVGLLIAGVSAGGIAGAALAGPIARRFGTARAMIAVHLCTAPFVLLVPLATPGAGLALVVVGGVLVTAGVVADNVIKGSFRQSYVPRRLLGRVINSMQLLNYGAIPAGALLGGALGTALGLRPTMWIMAGLIVASNGVLLIGPIKRLRDLPAAPAVPAGEGAHPLTGTAVTARR